MARREKCKELIIDISLKDGNGLDLVQEIKKEYEGLPTLVLSMYDESLYAELALRRHTLKHKYLIF